MLLNVPNGRDRTLRFLRHSQRVDAGSWFVFPRARYRRLSIIHGGCKTGTDRVVYSLWITLM